MIENSLVTEKLQASKVILFVQRELNHQPIKML